MTTVNAPADLLVIHSGAIGDVICALPGIRQLSTGLIVDLCCQKHIFPAIRLCSEIRNVIDINHSAITSVFVAAKNEHLKKWLSSYSIILLFSFSKDWENRFQKLHSEVYRIQPRPPQNFQIHVSDFIIDSLVNNQLLSDKKSFKNEFILQKKTKCYNNYRTSFSIIHPGSGSSFKNWPIERFCELAIKLRHYGHMVKWILGPAENNLSPILFENHELENDVIQLFQLETVIDLFELSDCYIGNDSGISHLAAFLGLNSTIIFGPSDPRRWKPMGTHVKAIPEIPSCPPCFELDNRNCSHRNCLNNISVEDVLNLIFLQKGTRQS